jgi:hypothetical protein
LNTQETLEKISRARHSLKNTLGTILGILWREYGKVPENESSSKLFDQIKTSEGLWTIYKSIYKRGRWSFEVYFTPDNEDEIYSYHEIERLKLEQIPVIYNNLEEFEKKLRKKYELLDKRLLEIAQIASQIK